MASPREINLGDTFDMKFTTIDSTGLPVTLAGTPAIAAYPDNSTTEITAGITLSVDFDTRTGLHNVRVVATAGNGYAADTNYTLVLTAGTVDGVSVDGYVVDHFSTTSVSLKPTTAGRTLDVTSTGAAGIDWANVENSTTAVDLSGTDIQLCDTVTTNTDMRGTDSALLASSAPVNFGDLSITITTGEVTVGTNNDKTGYALTTADKDDVVDRTWDETRSDHTTQGTYGESMDSVISASVNDVSATTTSFVTDLTEATDNHFNGRVIVFTSGVLSGQATDITGYTGSSKTVTVTALTEAPGDGDNFVIV